MTLPWVSDIEVAKAAVEAPTTRVTRRIEIYESDGVTLWSNAIGGSRLIDGAVTVDYNRDERRMMDLILDNRDREIRNDPYDGLWYDKIIKIYRGLETSTFRYETQIGEFQIDRIAEDNFPNFMKITGRDYTKKMMLSRIGQSITFSPGLDIEEVVTSLAANAGVFRLNIDSANQTLRSEVSFEMNTSRWQILKDLIIPYNLEIFFDRYGILTVRPFRDPTTSPTTQRLLTGQQGNLVSYSKSSNDTRIFNHVTVLGENQELIQEGVVVWAEAINNEPTSPTRVERIGTRKPPDPYKSSQFENNEQAQEYADTWLSIAALEEYSLDFSSFVYPWWEVGEVVEFNDPDTVSAAQPDRFLLDTLAFPMALGPGDGTGKRITIVGPGSVPGVIPFMTEAA